MNLQAYLRKERFKPIDDKKVDKKLKTRLSPERYERFKSLRRKRDNNVLTKEDVLEFYQIVASSGIQEIASSKPRHYRETYRTLKTIPDLCKEGKRILDAGYGLGLLTCWLGIRYPHKEIIGIDLSESMRRKAEKRRKKYKLKNVRFCTGDFTNTDFLDGHFDIITCIDALFETDPDYSLNEFSRILVKRGKVIVKFPHSFPPNSSERTKEFFLRGVRKMFTNSGFSSIEYEFKHAFYFLEHGKEAEMSYITLQAVKIREPKPISISYRTDLIGSMKYGYIWPLIKVFKKLSYAFHQTQSQ